MEFGLPNSFSSPTANVLLICKGDRLVARNHRHTTAFLKNRQIHPKKKAAPKRAALVSARPIPQAIAETLDLRQEGERVDGPLYLRVSAGA